MEKNWFKERLISAKKTSPLWTELADSIESMIRNRVEPLLERISNRKSIFTLSDEDIDVRIEELGRFFTIRTSDSKSKKILLSQRLDEIHFKGTDRPIVSTFWREFKNLPVSWEPLYAPIDQNKYPYGSIFMNESGMQEAKIQYGEFFLTSRGVINVSLNDLIDAFGTTDQATLTDSLIEKFDQIIKPLLPLHIVFNGVTLYLTFSAREKDEVFTLDKIITFLPINDPVLERHDRLTQGRHEITSYHQVSPAPDTHLMSGIRLDDQPADSWILDYSTSPCFAATNQTFATDVYRPDTVHSKAIEMNDRHMVMDLSDNAIVSKLNVVYTLDVSPGITTDYGPLMRFDDMPADSWTQDYDDRAKFRGLEQYQIIDTYEKNHPTISLIESSIQRDITDQPREAIIIEKIDFTKEKIIHLKESLSEPQFSYTNEKFIFKSPIIAEKNESIAMGLFSEIGVSLVHRLPEGDFVPRFDCYSLDFIIDIDKS